MIFYHFSDHGYTSLKGFEFVWHPIWLQELQVH